MSSSLNASGAPQPPTLFALPKPKKNLPQVAHPKANVSSDPDLRVQGESKVTTLSMDAGLSQRRHFQANQPTYFAADLKPAKSHTKLDKSLPPLTQRSVGGRCRTGAPSPAEGPPPTGEAFLGCGLVEMSMSFINERMERSYAMFMERHDISCDCKSKVQNTIKTWKLDSG